jgi:eukaryotic-like serine/threonine-protein kinase
MIGSRLGSWIIDRELGRGGMGCVYQAHAADPHSTGPRHAAVKVLAVELAAEVGFLERFQREIEILRKLDHPNIVRFYESGQQELRYFFAMEYIEGVSYQALLTERGRLPWPEVLDLALQIVPALKHAHDRGIIHRDLKPPNLLRLTNAGPQPRQIVKLTDFGIASLFASRHLTVTGAVVGTAEFLSPEQAAGKPVSRRSDLYSLGAVLYTLLTGRTPFEGELLDLLHKHRFAQFERPSRLVSDLPVDFNDIICELLAKEPAKRPPDASVLFRRLDSLRRKMERIAAGSAVPPTRREGGASEQAGPATLMSQLVREELEQQNRGGPVQRLVNRPVVLIVLFLTTVGLITLGLWPLGEEQLFQRGARLMASDDPDDWDTAWSKYLEPLETKYPNHPHQAEMVAFRRRLDARTAARKASHAARFAGSLSEAQWFYELGLRQRQQGDEQAARETWRRLCVAFKDVPVEGPWVELAQKELEKTTNAGPNERNWETLRAALEHIQQLRDDKKADDADALQKALEQLYQGDEAALKVIRGGK